MPWLHLCSVSSLKVAAVNPQRAKLHAKRIRLAGRVVVGSGGGGTGSGDNGAMAKAEEALLVGKAVALFAP